MEINPTRMCELLVGLPDVNVLGVADDPGRPLHIHIESRQPRPVCLGCGAPAEVKDRPEVTLVDLPVFGRRAPSGVAQADPAIASPRLALTDRAGRWVTGQVGRWGRTVNEVADELSCDWHTVNDAVNAYGVALVDHPDRIGQPTALGLDETLFVREGPRRRQRWSTSIVDVEAGVLLAGCGKAGL